jgi:biotin carboxyl carrier protein
MIAINEIRQIARRMQASGLGDIEISGKDFSLRMRCDARNAQRTPQQDTSAKPVVIKAAGKGVFLASHPMQSKVLAAAGERVQGGDCLGFLQQGDLLLPVRSPGAGEIARCLVKPGDEVGRSKVLFWLTPTVADKTSGGVL